MIGVISKGQSFATMLSMAVFMASILLSGIMFPTSMLPKLFVWIGRIFPAAHALQAIYGFAYQRVTDWDGALSLAILAGIGALMYLAAIIKFNGMRQSEQI